MTKNESPGNCWEFWDCKKEVREKCSAYETASGKECWMVAGSIATKSNNCPKLKMQFEHCWECPWFKRLNPDFDRE